ncbi:MAG: site-specific integrase [Acidobacteria bacterium]|nr:site-specific integrase [Acidobacteriota bacterium]
MARHRNHGLRKRFGCPPTKWPKCPHGWHFNFSWKGVSHRLSLDRECGRHIDSKTEAWTEADRLRGDIRNGVFGTAVVRALSFRQFADVWRERQGSKLENPHYDGYRLQRINAFTLPVTSPPLAFGDKALDAITTDDIEAFRDARKAAGRSAVTVNHDLKLLRKMFNWGIRKGYLERTPFKIGTEPAITLAREIPRSRRFENEEDEQRLLDAANPQLRAVIIAILDTACRPGEILSLQWRDVNLERRELTVQAVKSKTRTARMIPISSRLAAVLEMRRLDPAGKPFPPAAYPFGNTVGERSTSVRTAWENARKAAGLPDLQLRDLRHEAGSRFDEAGVPTNYVSKILGHANLTTTTRYLNINRRGLHRAMDQLEAHRTENLAQSLHTDSEDAQDVVHESGHTPASKSNPN